MLLPIIWSAMAIASSSPTVVVTVEGRMTEAVTAALEQAGATPIERVHLHNTLNVMRALPDNVDIEKMPREVHALAMRGLTACREEPVPLGGSKGEVRAACARRLGQSLLFTHYKELGADAVLMGDIQSRGGGDKRRVEIELVLYRFGADGSRRFKRNVMGLERDAVPVVTAAVVDLLNGGGRKASAPGAFHLDFPQLPALESPSLEGGFSGERTVRLPAGCSGSGLPRLKFDRDSRLASALGSSWPGEGNPPAFCRLRVHQLPAAEPHHPERDRQRRVAVTCEIDATYDISALAMPNDADLVRMLGEGLAPEVCRLARKARSDDSLTVLIQGVKGYRATKQVAEAIEGVVGTKRFATRKEGGGTVITFGAQHNLAAVAERIHGHRSSVGRLRVDGKDAGKLIVTVVPDAPAEVEP